MRVGVGTAMALGVLAIGAVPAVGFSSAGDDYSSPPETYARAAAGSADDKPGNGPPAWAASPHNGVTSKDGGRSKDAAAPSRDQTKPNAHAERMSSLGRAHGVAMRGWAACVSARTSGQRDQGVDPEAACGQKPVPPGHLKRQS